MALLAAILVPVLGSIQVRADTIFDAMAKAYENNPDLNAARAGLRATDEGVTIAKAGWRPQINAFAQRTQTWYDSSGPQPGWGSNTATPDDPASTLDDHLKAYSHQRGITITQQIFDGFQTLNNVRAAEATEHGILDAALSA